MQLILEYHAFKSEQANDELTVATLTFLINVQLCHILTRLVPFLFPIFHCLLQITLILGIFSDDYLSC